MRNKIILILILTAVTLPFTRLAADAVIIGTQESMPKAPVQKIKLGPVITAIDIKGNKIIAEDKILESVFSRIGDLLIEEKVESDIKAIYSTGFFDDVSASFESHARGTRIIFSVVENPVIKSVSFEGNTVFDTQKLISIMKTKPGQILNYKTLQEDIQLINDYYHSSGYIMARIADVSTDPKTKIIKLKIIEGVIESIALQGNDVTKDDVILREIDTKAGDVLNEKALARDLRRVFNLGFFSEITPNFEPGSSPEKIVLVIRIKEAKSSTINFGGGYGDREGWFGFIDLSLNNLLGTGHGTMIRSQWGQKLTTYQIKYYYPWFMTDVFGPRTSMTYRVWNTSGPDFYGDLFPNINTMRVGWDVALSRPFADYYSNTLSFGSETVRAWSTEDDTTTSTDSFEAYMSDFLGYALSYDTRDFWMNPTEGKYYSFSVREGWKKTAITTNYTKFGVDLNEFLKIAQSQVLALHSGFGIGFGDVPFGEYYWCGGANTVRGYGPSEAKLGIKKVILNAEYRYTFNEVFQAVLFYDFGTVWGDIVNRMTAGQDPDYADFMSGRGFGIRLNTPLGPIRLDYGIGDKRAFGEGILHFSIGHAF